MTSTRESLAVENRIQNWSAYGSRVLSCEGRPELRQIETTSVCNLRCIFCPYDEMTRPKSHMNLEKYRRLLESDECSHVAEVALHHFGEPFLQENFSSFVSIATNLGIRSVVSTNLSKLSKRQAEEVLTAGLSRIIVSIDASTPGTYRFLRRRGNLADVEKNLDQLLAAKLRCGSNVFVQVQFIVTPENHNEVEVFKTRWGTQEGVNQVVVRRERSHAGQRIRHAGYEIRQEPRLACRYLWESLVILQDGSAVPCCKDFNGRCVVGNIFDQSLDELWNGSVLSSLRAIHRDGRFSEIPLCKECAEWRGMPPFSAEHSRDLVQIYMDDKRSARSENIHLRSWE